MGSHNSRRMVDDESLSQSGSGDDSDHEIDYAAILQSLINRWVYVNHLYSRYLCSSLLAVDRFILWLQIMIIIMILVGNSGTNPILPLLT